MEKIHRRLQNWFGKGGDEAPSARKPKNSIEEPRYQKALALMASAEIECHWRAARTSDRFAKSVQ
jgi:hypothetical protein